MRQKTTTEYLWVFDGHLSFFPGATVVTHLPPTSEVCGSNPGPSVGKLVVAYQGSALYSTEP